MRKPKQQNKPVLIVKNESLEDFFARGKQRAKLIDQKKYVMPTRSISFEDIHDLVKFLTETKLNIISTVRKQSFSISGLAKVLHRSRASINKDIQLLEAVGILKSEYVANPGHGRQKMIAAYDKLPIKLSVETII